ncbi:hypothetical protein VaNZ11_014339 [Volvox africanus]|uniref:Uncharacterized protein n=1 Tax=Volvox africanus TaxID=51714 RepID=A0ABQ5SI81_9CHLO|nr:hypothetical protein VaNZ11_014339 [Volvox africanus]
MGSLRTITTYNPVTHPQDSLQRLHTLHNLNQLLVTALAASASMPDALTAISRTLRGHTLSEDDATMPQAVVAHRQGMRHTRSSFRRSLWCAWCSGFMSCFWKTQQWVLVFGYSCVYFSVCLYVESSA